jgi:hypothetical protein
MLNFFGQFTGAINLLRQFRQGAEDAGGAFKQAFADIMTGGAGTSPAAASGGGLGNAAAGLTVVNSLFKDFGKNAKTASEALKELNFTGDEFWTWYGKLLTGTGLPGTAGQEVEPDISGIVGPLQKIRGAFQSQLGTPEWGVTGYAEGDNLVDYFSALTGVPSLGMAMQQWIDTVEMVDTMPFEEKMQYMLDQVAFFGVTWQELGQVIGDTISGFFGTAVSEGLGAAGKKLLASLLSFFGKTLMAVGANMMLVGMAEIIMGSSPFTAVVSGANAPHGAAAVAYGAMLTAGGGALMGLGGAIGQGSSGSSYGGAYAESAGATRPAVETQDWTTSSPAGGGSTVNYYNINAIDTQSFNDALKKSGGTITGIIDDDIKSNGMLREKLAFGWGQ